MITAERILTTDTAVAVRYAVAVCQPALLQVTGSATVTAFIQMDPTVLKGP